MANKTPVGDYNGKLKELSAGDVIPIDHIATGTPDGTKYVRDDGTLATPPGGFGFTPEDVANKATDLTSPDNTKYPTTLAVYDAISASGGGTVTSVGGTGTVNGITLTGTVTAAGNLTLGGALTGVDLTTQVTGLLPNANIASAGTWNSKLSLDANNNATINNTLLGFTSTVTSGTVVTLTIASTYVQIFTGTVAQTVKLPTTSVPAGNSYNIINTSTQNLTVQSSGANTIAILAPGTNAIFTAVIATPTTAANWNAQYYSVVGSSGFKATLPAANITVARIDAAQTFTGIQTFTSPATTTSITTASVSFTAWAGATTLLTLGGTGAAASTFYPSTLDATSSITGAIRTSGGISAAKALNVGTTGTFGGALTASNLSGTNTGDNSANTLYSGLATSKQDALGFTPYNATNPSGYTSNVGDVTLTGTQTLTNKTLTTPIISSISNTGTITVPTTTGTLALTSQITGTNSGTNTGDNAVNSLYSGLVSNATHTGDATGATALTVVKINGTSLAGLATGILKNTTATGVPSIAVAADFPTLNQNTTGTAGDSTKINGITVTGTPSVGQVPTATSTSAATWQTPAGSGTIAPLTLNTQTSNYTLVLSDFDNNTMIVMDSATAVALTIPLHATVAALAGSQVLVCQKGIGQVIVVVAGGTLPKNFAGLNKLAGQDAQAVITQREVDYFLLTGELA